MVQILQQQTDSAGNVGWVLTDTINIDPLTIVSYLQSLAVDGHSYMAQIVKDNNTTILATVL